jgi:hypothetical protein
MSDVFVTLDVTSPEEDARLFSAIDAFVGQQIARYGAEGEDMLTIIVRSAFDATGALRKRLVFQNRQTADEFVDFWAGQAPIRSSETV